MIILIFHNFPFPDFIRFLRPTRIWPLEALFEAKTAAVELLRHCRFEMVPGQEITYGDKITMDIKSNGNEEFMVYVKPW